MKQKAKNRAFSQGLLAAIDLALGLVLLLYPELTGTMLCYVIGGFALVYGLAKLIGYLRMRELAGFFAVDLFVGIFLSGVGLFALTQPRTVLSVLPFLLGIALLLGGISKFQRAVELKRLDYDRWWVAMLLAALTAVFGLGLMLYPFSAASVMLRFVGGCLLFSGLGDLWAVFCYAHQKKVYDQLHAVVVEDEDVTVLDEQELPPQ